MPIDPKLLTGNLEKDSVTIKNYMANQNKVATQPNTVATNTTNAVQNSLTPPAAYNPTEDINKLKEAQLQQTMANLANSRNQALSNLNAEKKQIQPQFYNARNQVSTNSQLQGKNFAEYMANRGLTNSGTNAQAELGRNVALQGNLGALNQQETQAYADIARRESDINNAYLNDLNSARSGIEANAMNQLINANQRNYELGLNQYNTDRGFNFQQEQASVQNALNQAQFDFQKQQAAIDNAYRNGQMSLQQAQFELAKAEQAFNQKQVEIDNAFREKQFSYQQQQDDRNYKLAASRASSGGSGGSGGGTPQKYTNTTYKNDNQKSIYDYAMGKNTNDSWGTRMKTLYQAAEDPELSPEDRAYANALGYATRVGNYYDAAYEQYMKNRK